LAVTCVVALILHAPIVPSRFLGFIDLLGARQDLDDEPPNKAEAFVPIDLDLDDLKLPGEGSGEAPGKPPSADGPAEGDVIDPLPPPITSASVAPPPPPPSPPPPSPPPADTRGEDAMDAGVPDANPNALDASEPLADAGPSDAGANDAGTDADPSAASDAGPPLADAGPGPIASTAPDARPPKGPGIGDPDDVGKVSRGLTSAPNVQILLVGKQLRAHPLGADFGKLLRDIDQWKTFFDGTGIDPVADVDHMSITGPELRNSSKVVAVMELNTPAEKIRSAIDVVVKRDEKGEWLTGTKFPAARARADKAERLFVLLPDRRILTILPADQTAKIDGLSSLPAYPASLPFAIQLSMVTPHRAFRGIDAITMPDTIGKMRLRVVTDAQGGARLDLEFIDDPKKAEEDALVLEDQWKKVQTAAMFGLLFLDDLDFTANGERISGSTHFTKEQLAKIMNLARSNLMQEPKKPGKKPKKR